jgi:hypothetical protein
MGYAGKYTQVKEAVRELLRVKQEVFMPLVHRVGEAQVDFGYALAKVSGVLPKCPSLKYTLPYPISSQDSTSGNGFPCICPLLASIPLP